MIRPTRTSTLSALAPGLALAGLLTQGGCVPASDIMIHHPLVSRAVDANRVVKDHGFAEQNRGLPRGALADEAVMTMLDEQRVCFDLTVRELAPVDMQRVSGRLSTPGFEARDQPQLWIGPAGSQTYNGLVPERVQTGYVTTCTWRRSDGICMRYSTRPTYGTVYRPGPVDVHSASARMCFANGGYVTPSSEQVALDVRLPVEGVRGAFGAPLEKKAVFRWGLLGAVKAK